MCIDRRFEEVQTKLHGLQAVAAEENIQANQNEKFIFWLDRPVEQAVCNPDVKKAIKKGQWIVKQIQEFE
jgi:hypothetical protein